MPKMLLLDEAVASRAVFAIVFGLDGGMETLLEPAKLLKNVRGRPYVSMES